ncbi:MAG: pentapeptide repeat-containing protein [Chloroflexi bacterium]|nr:pentapeptide repeat-containing protein [Chloroflexota bacterium]
MAAPTTISVDEFIKKILAGERNLGAIQLAPGSDLAGNRDFAKLNTYLRAQDLRNEPLALEGSDWQGLKAADFFIQFAKLPGVNLKGADLFGADLRRSDLSGANMAGANVSRGVLANTRLMNGDLSSANLRYCDIYESNMTDANLRGADLSGARLLNMSLRGADLTGAKMTNCDLYRCDLRGAKGLETVLDLASGNFRASVVTENEIAVISAALRNSAMFDIRDE